MQKRCFIAGAGEYCDCVTPGADDYIIAADGGYDALIERGIVPDLVVGDFDSLGEAPEHPNVERHPANKDDTDMLLAVRRGLDMGYTTFIIDGGLGGRLDHSIANMQILIFIARFGARGVLLGRDICVAAVKDGSLNFAAGTRGGVSVFCAGDTAEGVTLRGLKYPLENAVLTNRFPLGVSNELTGAQASVSVRLGTLLVTWTGGIGAIDENHSGGL